MKEIDGRNGGTIVVAEKGESGNPKGRPVGSFSFKSLAEKVLEGEITKEQAGEIRTLTRKESIALGIIDDAVNNPDPDVRLRAAKMILEHTDPITKKVEQDVNLKDDSWFTKLPLEKQEKIWEMIKDEYADSGGTSKTESE